MLILEIMSFYDIGKLLIGPLPAYFEWVYVIFALAASIAFISVILSFLNVSFKFFKRW